MKKPSYQSSKHYSNRCGNWKGLWLNEISQDDEIIESGELTSGRKPGRRSDEEITICDLTGVGVQDTAIALLAYQKAMEKGLGLQIQV